MKLFLITTELEEIQSLRVHVPAPWHGIEDPVCVLCYQSNKALEKTEVGPYEHE